MLVAATLWLIGGIVLSLLHGVMIVHAAGHVGSEGRRTSQIRIGAGSVLRTLTSGAVLTAAILSDAKAGVAVGLGMVLGRWCFVLLARTAKVSTRAWVKG